MEFNKTKIKKVEVVCFFFKEQMNLQVMTDEFEEEVESSQLDKLLSGFFKEKRTKFEETSKELRHSLQAEGDMFLAYKASSNGKAGFAVTNKGVYVKSDGTRNFMDFETLSSVNNLRFEDNELRADGELLAVYNGSAEEQEKVINLFEEIITIMQDKNTAENDD